MLSKFVGSSKNKQPTIKYSKRNFASLAEAPSSSRVSTLSNGVRVVSMEFARPTAAVGVVVNAGTRHEDSHTLGSTAFLKHLGFQNSKTKTAVRLVREFELIGATYTVSASREQLTYMANCRFENVKDVVPLLAEATDPQFASYQISDAVHPVEEEAALEKADPRNYVLDAIHGQAFRHSGLGNSLYVTPDVAHHASVDGVKKFHDKLFVPQNFSIVGVGGVKHDQLVELAQKLFPASKASQSAVASSHYQGGEAIQQVLVDKTYFGIGYQGVAASHALAPASYILRFILGEASRASCEPVGNGVSGVLARNVFVDHAALQHLEASSFSYSDSGLLAVYGVAEPSKDYKYFSHLGNVLASVPTSLTQQHLQRGKALAKGHLAFQLTGSLPSLAEYVASQAIANPSASNFAPSQLASAIDSVSLEQLQQAAKQIFSSKPTVVAVGAVNNFPSL